MKVLVATKEKQGARATDFCFALEGELVQYPVFECSREELDGECGCRRSMCGLVSKKATTTMKVIETEKYEEEIVAAFIEAHRSGGWVASPSAVSELRKEVHGLLGLVSALPVGTVLERRDSLIVRR